ncbi:UNVERIFIED_CONTAM: hypothetical protein FKN15_048198 [Acipenser sinensis]
MPVKSWTAVFLVLTVLPSGVSAVKDREEDSVSTSRQQHAENGLGGNNTGTLTPGESQNSSTHEAVWLLYLFVVLGIAASELTLCVLVRVRVCQCAHVGVFPAPAVSLTCSSQGVTFLAFGNGAPDVFSAVAAFADPRTAGLAIGALFGAGVFVTTVVAGSVALVKPFTVASRPFLRDIIFYMAAVFWTFLILYLREIKLGEALGYLGLYVLYVGTVIVSTLIYNRQKNRLQGPIQSSYTEPELPSDSEDTTPSIFNGSIQDDESEYQPLLPFTESTCQIFINSINPIDSRKWRRKSWFWRAAKVVKVPLEVVLLLTVPVVDPDKDDHNWKHGLLNIEGEFPVWALVLLIGVFLSAISFLTTSNQQPPRLHCTFSLLGFVVSAMWINTAATEVVSILRTFGVVFDLSNTVLGLTLLAWGNSIGGEEPAYQIPNTKYPATPECRNSKVSQ